MERLSGVGRIVCDCVVCIRAGDRDISTYCYIHGTMCRNVPSPSPAAVTSSTRRERHRHPCWLHSPREGLQPAGVAGRLPAQGASKEHARSKQVGEGTLVPDLPFFWRTWEEINAATNTVVFKFDWFSFVVNVSYVTSPPFVALVATLAVTAIVNVIKEFSDSLRETFFQRRKFDGGRAHFVRILFVRFFHCFVLLVTIWKSNGRNTVRPFFFPSVILIFCVANIPNNSRVELILPVLIRGLVTYRLQCRATSLQIV